MMKPKKAPPRKEKGPSRPLSDPTAPKPSRPLSDPTASKPSRPLSDPTASKPSRPLSDPTASKPSRPLADPGSSGKPAATSEPAEAALKAGAPKAEAPKAETPKPANKDSKKEKDDLSQKQKARREAEEKKAQEVESKMAELLKTELEEAKKADLREHLNIVFIGHVDAGKSTIGGQILYLTGNVDERTIAKYEKEAKDKNRESWYMAYIMDTNDEERAKGKTVEVGRANFDTEKKRYTILDAPGHKNYVPNMIAGAAQADVGVLVVAARKGEFETGFDRGGQTREHAQLAKTLGVNKLIVVVNKMDDPSVVLDGGVWSEERFKDIQTRLTPFLKQCGYNVSTHVTFVPISGLHGHNMKDPVDAKVCPWWKQGSLFETLDNLDPVDRPAGAPFRMPVMDKYSDMGTMVMGKSEAGTVKVGMDLMLMPESTPVKVTALFRDDEEVEICGAGENLRLRLQGCEAENVHAGDVLCSANLPVRSVKKFEAQLAILELLEHKPLFTEGYKAVLHIHSAVCECEVSQIIFEIKPRTKEKVRAKFVKSGKLVVCRISLAKSVPMELFKDVAQLGRFTLRDEGKSIAIGKVTRLPKD